jgi:hypothetical protein
MSGRREEHAGGMTPASVSNRTPVANNATWDAQARHYTQSTVVARNNAPRRAGA